jgi:hypothetical protein
MNLQISAIGSSISQQCFDAGFAPTGMPLELVERISKAITLCHIQGMLTDSECDKARIRMIKAAKFQQVAPASSQPTDGGVRNG